MEPGTSCQGQLDDDLTACFDRVSAKAAKDATTSGAAAAQGGGQSLSSTEPEEEEAFLLLVTGQQEAAGQLQNKHAPLLQLRLPPDNDWIGSCALLDGASCEAGVQFSSPKKLTSSVKLRLSTCIVPFIPCTYVLQWKVCL